MPTVHFSKIPLVSVSKSSVAGVVEKHQEVPLTSISNQVGLCCSLLAGFTEKQKGTHFFWGSPKRKHSHIGVRPFPSPATQLLKTSSLLHPEKQDLLVLREGNEPGGTLGNQLARLDGLNRAHSMCAEIFPRKCSAPATHSIQRWDIETFGIRWPGVHAGKGGDDLQPRAGLYLHALRTQTASGRGSFSKIWGMSKLRVSKAKLYEFGVDQRSFLEYAKYDACGYVSK